MVLDSMYCRSFTIVPGLWLFLSCTFLHSVLSPLYIFNINTSCRPHNSLFSCPFNHSRRCLLHFSLLRTAETPIPMYEKFKSNALVLIIVQNTCLLSSENRMISTRKSTAKDWMSLNGPKVLISLTIPLNSLNLMPPTNALDPET